jgi:hypothetical protein
MNPAMSAGYSDKHTQGACPTLTWETVGLKHG